MLDEHIIHSPRYRGYRDKDGGFLPEYFHLLAIRLGFVIIFVVSFIELGVTMIMWVLFFNHNGLGDCVRVRERDVRLLLTTVSL